VPTGGSYRVDTTVEANDLQDCNTTFVNHLAEASASVPFYPDNILFMFASIHIHTTLGCIWHNFANSFMSCFG
jgi:hypothetical protein